MSKGYVVLRRAELDNAGIVAEYERERELEPRRCTRCRKLALPGTTRCKNHPPEAA